MAALSKLWGFLLIKALNSLYISGVICFGLKLSTYLIYLYLVYYALVTQELLHAVPTGVLVAK